MEEEKKKNARKKSSARAGEEKENPAAEAPEDNEPAPEPAPQDGGKSEEPAEKNDDDLKINKDDESTRKIIFALCYIFGILFFLPLILYKDAEARRHANEGLVLLLFAVVGNLIFGCLSVIGGVVGTVFAVLSAVYSVLLLLLGIIGIVFVATDRQDDLPLLGKIKIIK